jgi:hypothetical protein
LFGYAEYKPPRLPRVFMTTYGNYLELSPYRLFKANQRIQDWPRQTWIKLTYWKKDPKKTDWEFWMNYWHNEATVRDDIKQKAKDFDPGWGFGIGDITQVLHKVVDPPKPPNLDITEETLRKVIRRSANLKRVEYTKTMCGQCVVV